MTSVATADLLLNLLRVSINLNNITHYIILTLTRKLYISNQERESTSLPESQANQLGIDLCRVRYSSVEPNIPK